MKNILSYQQPLSGKEIKDWIAFHTANETEYSAIAAQMQRFGNIADEATYQVIMHPEKTIHGERFRNPIVVKIHTEQNVC